MDWQLVEKKQKINEFIGKKVPAMWYNNDKKVVKNMKKLIPVLAVLGSAVAFAVYKMKKEEQKKLAELDEGLLEDEPSFQHTETITKEDKEEASVQVEEQPKAQEEEKPEFSYKDKTMEITVDDIQQLLKETAEEEFFNKNLMDEEPVMPKASHNVEEPQKTMEMAHEDFIQNVFHSEYPHLTNRMVNDINAMTKDAIEALANDGDNHAYERPVQHMVSFKTKEDMDAFKSRVINKGFVITKGDEEGDLVVLHISPIDEKKLVGNILYLADQAYAFNGEYRGWQSKVSF